MDLLGIVTYIIGLGANVFLPIVMFFIGIFFGLKPGRAFRAGLILGIAFTALNFFVGQLLVGQVAPAAQEMIKRTGLHLSAMDVGWPAASAISWGWPYAASLFPLQIFLNIALIAVGFTKTLNVDLWNVWQKVFAAAVIFGVTDSLAWAYAAAVVMIVLELKIGDLTAKRVQYISGVPGVSVPHCCSTWLLLVAPFAYLLERTPGLNRLKANPEAIQRRFGFLGENMVIGLIMGVVIAWLAGYSLDKVLKLGITVATVMLLLPRLVAIFMEALMPISEAAAEFMKRRFPGREIYIGLDWPILAGHTTTITSMVALIPILILLSVWLPGNTVLPFGDLGNFGCLMAPVVAIVAGDMVRSLILGTLILAVSLWGASIVAASFTALAVQVGIKMPPDVTSITWLKTTPIIPGIIEISKGNVFALILFIAFVAVSLYILKKYYSSTPAAAGEAGPDSEHSFKA